jgi:hypothetical protein
VGCWGALSGVDQDLRTESSGSTSNAAVFGHGRDVSAAFRGVWGRAGLSLQATAPIWHEGSPAGQPAGVGLRVVRGDWCRLQVAGTTTRNHERIDGAILGDRLPMALNLNDDSWQVDARLGPWRRFTVEGNWRDSQYVARDPVVKDLLYQCMPGGDAGSLGGALRFVPRARHEVVLRYREVTFDLDAGLHWGGQQFGWLSYARGNMYSRLAAWKWAVSGGTAVRLEWEDFNVDGRIRASVESWPFTSTVMDLLGGRRIYVGTLAAQADRLTARVDLKVAGARCCVGPTWIRIRPDATWESWRPAFLAFGRADYRYDALRVTRLDLVALLVDAGFSLGPCDIDVALQQFVLGRAEEQPRESVTGGQGAPVDAPDADNSGWPGGTYVQVGVGWRFR